MPGITTVTTDHVTWIFQSYVINIYIRLFIRFYQSRTHVRIHIMLKIKSMQERAHTQQNNYSVSHYIIMSLGRNNL